VDGDIGVFFKARLQHDLQARHIDLFSARFYYVALILILPPEVSSSENFFKIGFSGQEEPPV